MPNKKSKQEANKRKRAAASKRDLAEMRMKHQIGAEGNPAPELPRASVRLRKGLRNRVNL